MRRVELGRVLEIDELPDAGAVPDTSALSDGCWIAFDSSLRAPNLDAGTGPRDIYIARPDGSSLRRLTYDPGIEQEPAFAADGRRLAFASDRVGEKMQIFVLDFIDRTIAQLTSRTEGADQPAWSADDQLIAFHSGNAVYTIKLDGTEEKKWFEDIGSPFVHPVFSPDGVWLVADRANRIVAGRLDGSEVLDILPGITNRQETPTISPTSAFIAFATYCEVDVESVWIHPFGSITAPCAMATRLSPPGSSARRPSWGPGGFIAYEYGDEYGDIEVISESGGAPKNITNNPADDRNPAWSPKCAVSFRRRAP